MSKVIFSDEAVFHIMNDRTQYVRCTSSDSLHHDCISTSVKHPLLCTSWVKQHYSANSNSLNKWTFV